MKLVKSSPIVVHIKKKLCTPQESDFASQKKRGPEPRHKGCKAEGPSAIRREVDPESIRSAWIGALGKRLKIDEQTGFYLDGRPSSLDAVMLETNRIRKANGMEQVGRKPLWLA